MIIKDHALYFVLLRGEGVGGDTGALAFPDPLPFLEGLDDSSFPVGKKMQVIGVSGLGIKAVPQLLPGFCIIEEKKELASGPGENQSFRELWTFVRSGDSWVLDEIEQDASISQLLGMSSSSEELSS